MSDPRKIVAEQAHHLFSPSDVDWIAYREGEGDGGFYGFGRTEEEAIADLQEKENER